MVQGGLAFSFTSEAPQRRDIMASTHSSIATDSETDLRKVVGNDATAEFEADPKFVDSNPTESASSENVEVQRETDDVEDSEEEEDELDDEEEDDEEEDDEDDEDEDDDDDDVEDGVDEDDLDDEDMDTDEVADPALRKKVLVSA
jgi:hypothetical protein